MDSVQVSLDLNIKYLWVDKYCINQSDEEDMAIQLRQMDLIYANAQVTIIAAAGDGPHHGLPGVAGTSRKPQPSLRVRDHYIASTLPHGSNIFLKSKWASRGWTYQESIFSKRRLIFTEEQVFWECNQMHSAEAIEFHSAQIDDLREGVFKQKAPGTGIWATDPWKILDHISEFRKEISVIKLILSTHYLGFTGRLNDVHGQYIISWVFQYSSRSVCRGRITDPSRKVLHRALQWG